MDANGNRIDPFLVRIGPNVDRSLERVSLDNLVEKEIQLRDIKEDTNNSIRIEILKKKKKKKTIINILIKKNNQKFFKQNKTKKN